MANWRPHGPFDLLIVEEAMYYLTMTQQRELLTKAFAAGDAVLMTVHDAWKHRATIANCLSRAGVVKQERRDGARLYLLLGA